MALRYTLPSFKFKIRFQDVCHRQYLGLQIEKVISRWPPYLGFLVVMILVIFDLKLARIFPVELISHSVQEKMFKIDSKLENMTAVVNFLSERSKGSIFLENRHIISYYTNTPIQIYRKLRLQKVNIFREKSLIFLYKT